MTTIRNAARWAALTAAVVAATSYPAFAQTPEQLHLFHALADQISLTEDDRRRALDLDDPTWLAWIDFLTTGGSLPVEPPLQDMLCRVAQISFNIALIASQSRPS